MEQFKIGQHYDKSFKDMSTKEVQDNLESVAYGMQETSYTKNLTEEEVSVCKDEYSEIGIELSELALQKKEAMERFKLLGKEPKARSGILLDSIKFKSEQRYGKLFFIDDQESGMMYSFDTLGVCVDARSLTKQERQTKLKSLKTGTDE